MFKIIHMADLHYSNNADKLVETDRCVHFALDVAERECVDVIVISGDTADEYDGRIRIDSEAARRLICFMERAANIAPVVVIRGTLSHDRDTPYLFRHLSGKHPIHVSSEIEQVYLCRNSDDSSRSFVGISDYSSQTSGSAVALFTCIPSIDKSHVMSAYDGSIKEGNIRTRGLLHDVLAGLGLANDMAGNIPRIGVAHGMVVGSVFGGQVAVGDDLEFSVNDLAQLHASYVALGHVHQQQSFDLGGGAKAYYSGSVGRMNFGEKEDKGVLIVEFTESGNICNITNVPTPARKFLFGDLPEWSGANNVYNEALCIARDSAGAHIRFRFSIPEEERASVDLKALRVALEKGGAAVVKIECQVVPSVRARTPGISAISSLREKVVVWGKSAGVDIPECTLSLAAMIESYGVEDLISLNLGGAECQ